jgi:hypothetical protein
LKKPIVPRKLKGRFWRRQRTFPEGRLLTIEPDIESNL